MTNKTCDYTRPGVEHWWTAGDGNTDAEDRFRDGAPADPSNN
ncbi:MAG TPA: hypothetical protein VGD51_03850 [Nocardioidaceae bacterium]